MILFFLQITLIALLFCTLIVVSIVQRGDGLAFYLATIGGLEGILLFSLLYNLWGNYKVSSWLTMIAMLLGPWISILFDPSIAKGDFIPLVYLVLPVQLCSIFLSERVTVLIAATQFITLAIFITRNPELMRINWPSLLCLVIYISTLGVISSFVARKQMDQILEDKVKLQENEVRLQELLIRDSLTGLFNRRHMGETLKREIGHAVFNNQSLGIIMADIDGFKGINDTYGHAWGDAVLVQVAKILSAGIRSIDIACRYGGDEFCLILLGCTLEETEKIAWKLHEKMLGSTFVYEGRDMGTVTLSIGAAAFPFSGLTEDEVLKAADKALYAAKNKGRNAVAIASARTDYPAEVHL